MAIMQTLHACIYICICYHCIILYNFHSTCMYTHTNNSVCNHMHGLNEVSAQLECMAERVTNLHTQLIKPTQSDIHIYIARSEPTQSNKKICQIYNVYSNYHSCVPWSEQVQTLSPGYPILCIISVTTSKYSWYKHASARPCQVKTSS